MIPEPSFADRIHARYPEGLTGVFGIGGTRTTYILKKNRQQANPGHIQDFPDYANYLLTHYLDFISLFLSLGGQNMLISLLSPEHFTRQGSKYAEFAAAATLDLINERTVRFYQDNDIDPYFVGIDTLLHLPSDHFGHRLGERLTAFQRGWPYQAGRRRVLWEIVSIPLFSFWKAPAVMDAEQTRQLETDLTSISDLDALYERLYRYYAQAVYGTDFPMPHFYLGSNRKGKLQARSLLPFSLLCGGSFRLFYTPYPSLFITRPVFQAILEDLAFGRPIVQIKQSDYSGEYTPELAEAEYQRFTTLSSDPLSTVGLLRAPDDHDES